MATPQELVSESVCFGNCIPDKWAALLWAINEVRINGGGDVMTPQEIVTASACFGNCIPDKWAVLLWGINTIVENGGGGTSGLVGVVNPEGVVTAEPGTTYYNTANATFWVKASGSGSTGWMPLI